MSTIYICLLRSIQRIHSGLFFVENLLHASIPLIGRPHADLVPLLTYKRLELTLYSTSRSVGLTNRDDARPSSPLFINSPSQPDDTNEIYDSPSLNVRRVQHPHTR